MYVYTYVSTNVCTGPMRNVLYSGHAFSASMTTHVQYAIKDILHTRHMSTRLLRQIECDNFRIDYSSLKTRRLYLNNILLYNNTYRHTCICIITTLLRSSQNSSVFTGKLSSIIVYC